MKIECPKCGQHYEVDSSALDRHFRCTECKTFFLGLNAKAVKVQKFVPKDSVEKENDPEDKTEGIAENTSADPVNAGNAVEVVSAVKAVQVVKAVVPAVPQNVETENKNEKKQPEVAAVSVAKAEETAESAVKITREQTSEIPFLGAVVVINRILAVAAGILVLVALALILVQKSQLDNLKKENSKLERTQVDLSRKVEALMSLADKYNQCNGELEALRLRLKEHREDSSNQQKQQDEKIAAGEEKIKTLTADVEALNKKVGELGQRHIKTKKTRLAE